MDNRFGISVDNNPFYKAVFDVNFKKAANEEKLIKLFNKELNNLTTLIKTMLDEATSITQTAEIFHYSALSCAFLQHKAALQNDEIMLKAPPEYSVEKLVLSQFGIEGIENIEKQRSWLSEYGSSESKHHTWASDLAAKMSEPYKYSGSLMRALVMIAVMSVCACNSTELISIYKYLGQYKPVRLMLNTDLKCKFSVIGTMIENRNFGNSLSMTIERDLYEIKRDPYSEFCKIFALKLEELLKIEKMNGVNRARTEELRDIFFDTLCRFFFTVRALNFPRILSLINEFYNASQGSSIAEITLQERAPAECIALLKNEAVFAIYSIDMDMSWYRINNGMQSFAKLVTRFNLLTGYKLELLNDVIYNLEVFPNP